MQYIFHMLPLSCCYFKKLLFYSSCYHAIDDLFLQYYIQDQDRNNAQQKSCHDRAVVCRIGSIKAVGRQRQRQQFLIRQYQRRQKEIIPECQRI